MPFYVDGHDLFQDWKVGKGKYVKPYRSRSAYFAPQTGWTTGRVHNISVSFCNELRPTSCNDTIYSFEITTERPDNWVIRLNAWTSNTTGDSVFTTLYFGSDIEATTGYDSRFDIPSFMPDFGRGAFFTLSDSLYPSITRLQTDDRGQEFTTFWKINYLNPLNRCGIRWDVTQIFDLSEMMDGTFYIGTGASYDELTWYDMSRMNRVSFTSGNVAVIKWQMNVPDEEPPVISDINPSPSSSFYGYTGDFCVSLKIIDTLSGVNLSTLSLEVNSETLSEDNYELSLVTNGVNIRWCSEDIASLSSYDVSVNICDNARIPNCINHSWSYSFTSCITEFTTPIWMNDVNPRGDTLAQSLLEIGVRPSAMIARDEFDVPSFGYPSGTFFYFPVDDPVYYYLSSDFRPSCQGSMLWVLGADRITGGNIVVKWNIHDLPADERWSLGIASSPIGSGIPDDDEFVPMSSMTSFSYSVGRVGYIKSLPYIAPVFCASGQIVFCDGAEDVQATVSVPVSGLSVTRGLETGNFDLCNLRDGSWDLEVSSEGYRTTSINVTISGEDLTIESPVILYRNNVLKGIVFLEGVPQSDIIVEIDGLEALTADDGGFEFCAIENGEYEICFRGFEECYRIPV